MTKRKAPKTAWKQGESGNPGGRPRLTDSQRLARELRAQAQPAAVVALARIVSNVTSEPRDVISAARALLDGLDVKTVETSVDVSIINPYAAVTVDELKAIARAQTEKERAK